jgi:hypothetical protein
MLDGRQLVAVIAAFQSASAQVKSETPASSLSQIDCN